MAGIILIVDSSSQAMQLKDILEKYEFEIVEARNGFEALLYIEQYEPMLVISDVNMPDMDGYQLCKNIKSQEETKNLPVILLTALSDSKEVVRGLECGADGFFTKPYNEKYLLNKIQVLVNGNLLKHNSDCDTTLEVNIDNENFIIKTGPRRILNFLISIYQITIQKNNEKLRQMEDLKRLCSSTLQLVQSLELRGLAGEITRSCVNVFQARMGWLCFAGEDGGMKTISVYPEDNSYPDEVEIRWDHTEYGQGIAGRAVRGGAPIVVDDLSTEQFSLPWRKAALEHGFHCAAAFPLINREKPFGVLLLYSDRPGFFGPERLEFLQTYANQAAAALEKARLFEEAERRLSQVQALRNIDMAIAGCLDLRVTFSIVLEQVMEQLGVHAADILLLNQHVQILEFAAARGFYTRNMKNIRIRVGDGNAGRAALERKIVHVPDIREAAKDGDRSTLFAREGFLGYYVVPLVSKNIVKGVLEIFYRDTLKTNLEWHSFLETLAGQTVIAIDNALLFNDLQRSNNELIYAYDATIEGWAYALDLRDKETFGHSRRVTDITVKLARMLGIGDAELVHVRRGALLHDIGKMGVPDQILLKSGDLSMKEWEIMRLHPVYAFEMLSSIDYLRPAIDIPYCHHERWDGSGYPRGLKGKEIPLAARIFTVVDVWDALRSNRPYRPAWPEDKVRDYLRSSSGSQFDPKVVDLFLSTIW